MKNGNLFLNKISFASIFFTLDGQCTGTQGDGEGGRGAVAPTLDSLIDR